MLSNLVHATKSCSMTCLCFGKSIAVHVCMQRDVEGVDVGVKGVGDV